MKNIFVRTKIFSCSAPRAAEELDAGGRGGQPGVPAAAGAGGEGDEEQQARGGGHLPHQVRDLHRGHSDDIHRKHCVRQGGPDPP